jgi:formylglycine-generating enzyme required for sulfatase activity/carbonic anhydrase/acetyltransferase-like protein (isoleucine patch superfamily)
MLPIGIHYSEFQWQLTRGDGLEIIVEGARLIELGLVIGDKSEQKVGEARVIEGRQGAIERQAQTVIEQYLEGEDVYIEEATVVGQNLIVRGNLYVNAPLIVEHNIIVGGNIYVSCPTVVGHDVFLWGDLYGAENGCLIGFNALIGGQLYIEGGSLAVGHDLWVRGDLGQNRTLSVANTVNENSLGRTWIEGWLNQLSLMPEGEQAVLIRLLSQSVTETERLEVLLPAVQKMANAFWQVKGLMGLWSVVSEEVRTSLELVLRQALRGLDTPERLTRILLAFDDMSPGVALPFIQPTASPLLMDWCWVPGGEFQMGSEAYDSEKPIHPVKVAGFWLGRYPVTNEQYRLFMEAGGYEVSKYWTKDGWTWRKKEKVTEPRYWQDAKWNGKEQPVVGVSWYEAMAFCRWAAEVTGNEVRLPTEAEWEKGARGTDERTYPWGVDKPDKGLCNYERQVGQTTPVGEYSPQGDSPHGNGDMAGNVWEWCMSEYEDYPYEDDARNDENGTSQKVLRGGSWDYINPDFLRTSFRFGLNPSDRANDVGFRCASKPF